MHIIFYVLDSLRADHLSCYGYRRRPHQILILWLLTGWFSIDVIPRQLGQDPWLLLSSVELIQLSMEFKAERIISIKPDPTSGILTKPRIPNCMHISIGNVSTVLGFARGFDYFCDLYKNLV